MNAALAVHFLALVNRCRFEAARHPGEKAYAETLAKAEHALDEFDNARGYCRPGRLPVRPLPPIVTPRRSHKAVTAYLAQYRGQS